MKQRIGKRMFVALALAGGLGAAGLAQAQTTAESGSSFQQPPAPTAAQMDAMRRDVQTAAAYPLPGDFLPRMVITLQTLRGAGIQPPPPGGHVSLNETVQRVEAVPGLRPVLQANGFTARDFVMGLTCFGITYAVTSHAGDAQGAPRLNPQNVQLLQSDPQGVQALLQEMGSQPAQSQQ